MLDVALINLIAAGLDWVCRPPTAGDRTFATEFDGENLIRKLTAAEPAKTGQLIARVVEDVWQSCRVISLPAELAEPHIAFLSDIIGGAHLRSNDQAMFFAPEHQAPDKALADLSQRIVSSIEHDFAESGVDETVLTYLLETFLASLYAAREMVQAIQPLVATILPPPLPSEMVAAASQSAVMLAKIERAEALGIAVPILDTITVALINTTRSADLRQADLLAAAGDARKLAEALARLPERAPAHADYLRPLSDMFCTGRIVDCDRALVRTEDLVVRHSVDTSAHTAGHIGLASELRTQRACLAALEGSFTKAARHYGFAQRYIPRADFEIRWHFAELEAHYYELAAFYKGDSSGLENAARACTSALATMPTEPSSVTRARAQITLGHILILLGEKEREPDRFELAAQLLGDAEALLDGTTDVESLARRTTILRALALNRLGVLHRKSALLENAASLYQSVIEQPSSHEADDNDDPAEIGLGLRLHMALTLIDYADLEPGEELRRAAIASIQTALPNILAHHTPYNRSGYNRCLLAARCHEALAGWHNLKGESAETAQHLADAAVQYGAAGFARDGDIALSPAANVEQRSHSDGEAGNGEANAA